MALHKDPVVDKLLDRVAELSDSVDNLQKIVTALVVVLEKQGLVTEAKLEQATGKEPFMGEADGFDFNRYFYTQKPRSTYRRQ